MQRYNIGLLLSFRHLKWQLIINALIADIADQTK